MSSVSADGRYVAFNSSATNLASGCNVAGIDNVFIYDHSSKKTTCVSLSADNDISNGSNGAPSISGDGSFVVFGSWATNLSSELTGGHYNIFMRNILTGAIKMLSKPQGGSGFLNADSSLPQISADGKSVAFLSRATNAYEGNKTGLNHLFVVDAETSTFKKCSNIAFGGGLYACPHSYWTGNTIETTNFCNTPIPSLSADGQ